jgi:hypothetical protein
MGVWTFSKSTETFMRNWRMFELFDVPKEVSDSFAVCVMHVVHAVPAVHANAVYTERLLT